MSRWTAAAVLAFLLVVPDDAHAQAAPALISPTPTTTASPKSATEASKSTPKPKQAAPGAYKSDTDVKRKSVPTTTDQVPDGHKGDPPETITVLKSKWDQMGADLNQAAQRIIELRKQAADLQRQVDELKKKPGCSG